MSETTNMQAYYQRRAPVYDDVYAYPERQLDLRYLEARLPGLLAGLDVLELAAGTGYWTAVISQSAQRILATDREPAQLARLEQRSFCCPVEVQVADAFALETALPGREFTGLFAGLWVSHIRREQMQIFFEGVHRLLTPGATVVLLDNSLSQCNRLPITRRDERGNTYQDRLLDGRSYRVLKNFPTPDELRAWTGVRAGDYQLLDHYWVYQYKLP